MNNGHVQPELPAQSSPSASPDIGGAEDDPFAPYRRRVHRNYWMIGLQAVEAGDLFSPENHKRIFEALPEDGIAFHTAGARGELALLVSIPEEQLKPFAEGEWRVGRRLEEDNQFVLALWVGPDEGLECPFTFDLKDEQQVQEAIQLTERQEVDFYGMTYMEEGLMLTIKGSVLLPEAFREEVQDELLRVLAEL